MGVEEIDVHKRNSVCFEDSRISCIFQKVPVKDSDVVGRRNEARFLNFRSELVFHGSKFREDIRINLDGLPNDIAHHDIDAAVGVAKIHEGGMLGIEASAKCSSSRM